MEQTTEKRPAFQWAVPASLGVPEDRLRLRLDFFHQAVKMTAWGEDKVAVKLVSAMDVAHALANELAYGTGLLPDNALWWSNAADGPITAIYDPPQIRIIALKESPTEPPRRFKLPLPGFVFLCSPGKPPAVYAVKHKPKKESDQVYMAPLFNVFQGGQSCGGSHKYPTDVGKVVDGFFLSFFSPEGHGENRSIKFPHSVYDLWDSLDGKTKYPLKDLVPMGTVGDLMKVTCGVKLR